MTPFNDTIFFPWGPQFQLVPSLFYYYASTGDFPLPKCLLLFQKKCLSKAATSGPLHFQAPSVHFPSSQYSDRSSLSRPVKWEQPRRRRLWASNELVHAESRVGTKEQFNKCRMTMWASFPLRTECPPAPFLRADVISQHEAPTTLNPQRSPEDYKVTAARSPPGPPGG